MPLTPEDIQPGIPVSRISDAAQTGILTGRTEDWIAPMAEVQWSDGRCEYTDCADLKITRVHADRTLEALVHRGEYGTVESFRNRITFEKLQGALTDVFYSMKTSEIDFYAHQFKPIVRFIESPTNRLLIADEVGLGKTIEAGLIWTECQARFNAKRMLVVCPPTLIRKWVRELQERFQIPAEHGDAARLLDLTNGISQFGSGFPFVFVTSYHSLRPFRHERAALESLLSPNSRNASTIDENKLAPRARLLKKVLEWEERDPLFDLVVFDEAHIMKNTASASYVVGSAYSAASDASLCLSATPIHNESRDLYALMRLIDPDFFRDQFTFDMLREQNKPVIRMINHLASDDFTRERSLELCKDIVDSPAKKLLVEDLDNYSGKPGEKVRLLRRAELLNRLGSFINRTRKRDVIEGRVIREPVVLDVTLSEQERALYQGVLELIRRQVRARGEALTAFHLIMPALLMSSSLPVIASNLRDEGRWGGFEELAVVEEDFEFEASDTGDEELESENLKRFDWVSDYDFEKHDSKYAKLQEDLVSRVQEGKILVFAFFKATIRYLDRRLTKDGFKVASLTGDIQDQAERDRIIQGFRTDDNQILLCSEVGSEGIDLQFCRIMVNYDLPWNPMRVEQRIGRIDRLGQQAQSITIVNFRVAGTIDASVYDHLYRKIEIFETTIGDLEGIVGEPVKDLTKRLLTDELTPQQADALVEQTGDAIENNRELQKELEASKGAIIAHRDFLDEQIGESERLGRFVKPPEIRRFVETFFDDRFTGGDRCDLSWDDPDSQCLRLKLSIAAWESFHDFLEAEDLPTPKGFVRNRRSATMTFDPEVLGNLRDTHRELILVSHVHPFMKWVTKESKADREQWHPVSAVRLEYSSGGSWEFGDYYFLVFRMDLSGLFPREKLFYAVANLASGEVETGEKAEALLNHVLDRGSSIHPGETPDYSAVLGELKESIKGQCREAKELYEEEMRIKIETRRDQLSSHFNRKLEIQRNRLRLMEDSPEDRSQGIRLTKAQIEKLEERRDRELNRLERSENIGVNAAEVACGLLKLEAP